MKPLLQEGRKIQNGVCLHHRGGDDWMEHCKIWTKIGDGIWRKNCNTERNRALHMTITPRIQNWQWIYYVGDFDTIPEELKEKFSITSKEELLGIDVFTDQKHPFFGAGRDMKALVDTLVCNQLPYFIGNSVSTWSAIQLAQRKTQSSWYNSRSIPLSQVWKVYEMPIVYTYTEESLPEVKHLLKVSILSVKKNMPQNPIQVVYCKHYANEDEDFQRWLKNNGVLVYYHNPSWKTQIEEMRSETDESTVDPRILSTLRHSGTFFGTWQKIDIPNFIFSEYCLYMNHEVIVKQPFSMIDFGLQIVPSLAFTSYENQHLMKPRDTSVLLMNVPHMRETLDSFHSFIFNQYSNGKFSIPSTVEGAYVDFYRPKFLDRKFGHKVYWETNNKWHKMMAISFRDLSPFDVVDVFIRSKKEKGGVCTNPTNQLIAKLCEDEESMPVICPSLELFAKAAKMEDDDGDSIIKDFCRQRYGTNGYMSTCESFLNILASKETDTVSLKTRCYPIALEAKTKASRSLR